MSDLLCGWCQLRWYYPKKKKAAPVKELRSLFSINYNWHRAKRNRRRGNS
ncbi:hypothetical protein HMPREF0083_04605 [Aneurinibacillus aneurinilyticus ATCC 12856]|uniref:Uncharacterized protein n=1 Tax=Aneurinibacillus aneurinilyticus ATCC 12856 TaxID=649747 RepID=U1Y940_ANEAE|nr:hypothetical protein HMPREF0083_04605 [Aneurinibacillus aneurinilyticus ATCC 12856]